ncbi:hypothetical protein MA4S0206_3157 [Mycobacteroides abscessus 4S-0206]|nr:hypothetical protein MA4S0206_3157 [Mycobacteroides abscessus 4S-0206]
MIAGGGGCGLLATGLAISGRREAAMSFRICCCTVGQDSATVDSRRV